MEVAPTAMCVLLGVFAWAFLCGFPPRIGVFCLGFPPPIGERSVSNDKIVEHAPKDKHFRF